MKITFGKVKIREFDDTPSCPVLVNGVEVGSLKRGYFGPNDFSDWYMDSSSLGVIIPDHESAGWSRIAEAKRDVSKWIKRITPKEIAKRLVKENWWSKSDRNYKTLIEFNAMRIESNLVKTSKAEADVKKFYNQLRRITKKAGFDGDDFPILEISLEFDNFGAWGSHRGDDNTDAIRADIDTIAGLGRFEEIVEWIKDRGKVKVMRQNSIFKNKKKAIRDINKFAEGKLPKLKVDLIFNLWLIHAGIKSGQGQYVMTRMSGCIGNILRSIQLMK